MNEDPKISFAKRLNHALDLSGIARKGKGRQLIVAQMFGVSQKGASKWLEGLTYPELEKIAIIANRLNVNVEWLTYGTGFINREVPPSPANKSWKKVPLISWEQAADINKFIPNLKTEWIWSDIEMGARCYAVTVKDESMEPRYEKGAILMVDPDLIASHRRIVIVRWKNTQTASCTQLLIDGPNRYLKPHNPTYSTTLIDEKSPQVDFCGVVTQVFMNY